MAGKGPVITVTLTADAKGVGKGVKEAEGIFKGLSGKMTALWSGVGASLGTMATNLAGNVISAAGDWIGKAQQAELAGKKANTVFGSSADDVKKWADSVNEAMGLSDEAVTGLAANMGDLLVPLGFTRDQAADMSEQMIGLSGALSAWSGGTVDAAQVSDILTKAMLGETDGLKQLGIAINQDEVNARVAKNAKEGLTFATEEQAKAVATQQLILEKSSDAQKAWNDGTMDSIKNQNEMKASWEDAKVKLGQALLPLLQKVTKFVVEKFIPWIKDVVAAFKENWPKIKTTIMNAIQPIIDIVKNVVIIVQALWKRFGDRILQYAQVVWNFIRNIIEAAMRVIQGIIQVITGIITGDWSKAWEGIKNIFSGVWQAIQAIVSNILGSIQVAIGTAWDTVKGIFSGAWEGIKEVVSTGVDEVVGFVTGLPGKLLEALGDLLGAGKDLGGAFLDGLKEGLTAAAGFAGDVAGAIVKAVKDAWNAVAKKINDFVPNKIGWGRFSIDIPDNPIPTFATGTSAFPGGLAMVGEAGRELVSLPRGSRIFSSLQTQAMMNRGGTGTYVDRRTVNVYLPSQTPERLAESLYRTERRNGRA